MAVLENPKSASSSFTVELRQVFDHLVQSSKAASQILSPHQGSSSIVDCSIRFRILAARNGWNDVKLWGVFFQGLTEELKDELATRDESGDLKTLISLAIWLDNQLQERCRQRVSKHLGRNSGNPS